MVVLEYRWHCQRCGQVELVGDGFLDTDNPAHPRGWSVVEIGRDRTLLCGSCVAEILAVLNAPAARPGPADETPTPAVVGAAAER